MPTVKIDNDNFQSDVLESETPVVVDFWAEWCGPCKMIAPSLEEISDEMGDKVKIAKVNMDENPGSGFCLSAHDCCKHEFSCRQYKTAPIEVRLCLNQKP